MSIKFSVKLSDCPPGLFIFEGTLCFKSEYHSTNEHTGFSKTDAYVVDGGEYFWGGASHEKNREDLMVTPVAITHAGALRIRDAEIEL